MNFSQKTLDQHRHTHTRREGEMKERKVKEKKESAISTVNIERNITCSINHIFYGNDYYLLLIR